MLAFHNVLVISAHADDETFGMGGTLLRLKDQGAHLTWLVMSRVWEPRWSRKHCLQREADIDKVVEKYRFNRIERWPFPDQHMEQVPFDDYQSKMIALLDDLEPDTIFTPGPWDWNWEHRLTFEVVEASSKPSYSPYLRHVLAYEIPSSTDWAYGSYRNFQRNFYVDIAAVLERKVEVCLTYATETGQFPHPRSAEGVRHLAAVRGMESGLEAAEAFATMRWIAKANGGEQ